MLLVENVPHLKNFGFCLYPGAIMYIYGENGSGKTMLLRHISRQNSDILYISHNLGIDENFSVREDIYFWAKIYNSLETADAAIAFWGLDPEIKIKNLSEGNKKKVALARLLACDSYIWLLDEVEVNLDKDAQKKLSSLLSIKADNGGIIIVTSHFKPLVYNALFLNLKDYAI